MSLKKIFFKSKFTYKVYLYYNLYIRHKGFIKRERYSQWGEDQFIAEYFKDTDKGIYLDIGCFNPFMYSNTCLLHNKGWSGINIDINPTSIDLFKIARPKDFNICTTINNEKKSFEIFFDDPFSPVNTLDKNFFNKLGKSFSAKKNIVIAMYYPSNYEFNVLKIQNNLKNSKVIFLLPKILDSKISESI